MAETVYLLCALTSAACAVLLLRSWLAGRQRLVLWTALGFAGLALNNVLLFIDLALIGPNTSLQFWRDASTLGGLAVLLAGMVWESR
ncbi:MAG TPA: DUF5985 family protein [Mycobacteriales bacterium]|nr:DUF5985 family protein [Mycobacteriales bacterium]